MHLNSALPLCMRTLHPCPTPFCCMGLLHPSSPTSPSRQNGPVRGRSARLVPSLPRARRPALDVTRISLRPVPSLVDSDPSHDPSHLTRFESSRPDPSLPRSASTTPYVPATVALGRRHHYHKGFRGYRAIARRRRRAGAGGALPHPWGPPCGVGSTPAGGRA
jgi:hypothetical protein